MAEVDRSTSASTLHTEFAFALPRGYIDEAGTVHREGVISPNATRGCVITRPI
jgi:hypothetical protein